MTKQHGVSCYILAQSSLPSLKRGGSKKNLSNIINSHTAAWDKDMVPTVQSQITNSKASRKSTENSRLAAAVSTKLEAGNFRAAVRIICSSDAPAPVNQDTLNTLQTKSPGQVTHQHQLTRTR